MSVRLVPVTPYLARLALAPDLSAPDLSALGLVAAPGWPHADTADVVRPLAEHGAALGTFLALHEQLVIGECCWLGEPDAAGEVEIGYGVAPGQRRQGHGVAMVAELVAWVRQQPGVRRIRAEALVGNEASRRLLHRAGFTPDGRTRPPYVGYQLDLD